MKLSSILSFVLLLSFSYNASGQKGFEEELGFIFTKAKYLLDTERYENAIKELNNLIKKDPEFNDALLHRARAKYEVGAFAGAKKDLSNYIGYKGISADVVRLSADIEHAMDNKEAALNSISTAIALDSDPVKLLEKRAGLYYDLEMDDEACKDWAKAAKMGSMKARRLSSKNCDDYKKTDFEEKKKGNKRDRIEETEEKKEEKVEDVVIHRPDSKKDDDRGQDDRNNEEEEESDEENRNDDSEEVDTSEQDYEDDLPEEDNTVKTIEVDEDLTLQIYGEGLGRRSILNQPNILILSDEDGKVVLNVCVNRNGKVISADFDPSKSTITKESLVSLASRKVKEFWWEKSRKKEQCGYIVFDIHGS